VTAGRRSERRKAVFILYQQDLLNLTTEDALGRLENEDIGEYARGVVCGVGAQRRELDEILAAHVAGWKLERLGVLERAILRVATYELLRAQGVPRAVVIDQAVELAKRFCSEEAGALVNGVLGAVAASSGDSREADGEAIGDEG
jgi:N utilization substance protein B